MPIQRNISSTIPYSPNPTTQSLTTQTPLSQDRNDSDSDNEVNSTQSIQSATPNNHPDRSGKSRTNIRQHEQFPDNDDSSASISSHSSTHSNTHSRNTNQHDFERYDPAWQFMYEIQSTA